MTHKEFVDKYIGGKVDYDGVYNYQCVDLARQYCKDTGNEIGNFSGSALNGWTSGSPFDDKWEKIIINPSTPPKEGSVIFFDKTKSNPYGHVAIVDSSNTAGVCIIEQNAGNGNGNGIGSNAIKRTSLSYSDVTRGKILGWFTLKNELMENLEKIETVSKYKQIYIQERPQGYKPIFSDYKEDGDTKYLIEIANIRTQKK